MQPTTVIIVDDIAETRASVKRLLELNEGFTVIGEAGNGQEAISQAQQLQPDCVLLDINMPVLDGIAAAETLSLQCPTAAIIMMSVQGEQEYLRKAMAAGARDYLIKPFGSEELSQAITRAVALTHRRVTETEPVLDTRYVLVAGPKGGVGRTTVAINIAMGLAASGEATCLLDLNTQFSDMAMAMDVVPAHTLASLAESATLTHESVSAALETYSGNNLRILYGPARPEEAEAIKPDMVDAALGALDGHFKWLVVDSPAAMTESVLPVLDREPELLLVVTPELASVRNAGQYMQLLSALECVPSKVRVVLNRWDAHSSVTPDVVERNLGIPVNARIPFDPTVMQMAATRGVPVLQGDAKSNSARALQGVVDELLGKGDTTPKRRMLGLVRRETRWAMS